VAASHFSLILFMAGWFTDVDIGVFDVESRIDITKYDLVGFDDSLQIHIYEEVVRINVLLD